jgi:hypothetical protein
MSKTLAAIVARNPDKARGWYRDSDGYWIDLKPGWCFPGPVHACHGTTLKETLSDWRCVEPCDCDDCARQTARA